MQTLLVLSLMVVIGIVASGKGSITSLAAGMGIGVLASMATDIIRRRRERRELLQEAREHAQLQTRNLTEREIREIVEAILTHHILSQTSDAESASRVDRGGIAG